MLQWCYWGRFPGVLTEDAVSPVSLSNKMTSLKIQGPMRSPLSPLPGSRHHPSYYLDNCYFYVRVLLPLSDVVEGHLVCSLTSGCCSHGRKVGMELGRACWPCFLSSHFVLFLNLLLGTVVSPFMPSLPQATCLETARPGRSRLCSCPQCSLSAVSFC